MQKTVGIIGGMGPEAGVAVLQELLAFEQYELEQDRLSVILHSFPSQMPDRNDFISGHSLENPGHAIAKAVVDVGRLGAEVVGVACNAAHAPSILSIVEAVADDIGMTLISMVDAAIARLRELQTPGAIASLGVLGTYQSQIYETAIRAYGMDAFQLSPKEAQDSHDLVWSREFGVKYFGTQIRQEAHRAFADLVSRLKRRGCTTILMACTELPLIANSLEPTGLLSDIRLVDVNSEFARRLYLSATQVSCAESTESVR